MKVKLINNQAFTLLESLVVIFIFTTAIVIVSQVYFSLVKTAVLAQNYQLAFDNLRFGTEKIWTEVKSGSDFSVNNDNITFKDRKCNPISIYKQSDNIFFRIRNTEVPLFDENLVRIINFQILSDRPLSSGAYYEISRKILVFKYEAELKTRTLTIPIIFHQTVAPSNSVLVNKPCR